MLPEGGGLGRWGPERALPLPTQSSPTREVVSFKPPGAPAATGQPGRSDGMLPPASPLGLEWGLSPPAASPGLPGPVGRLPTPPQPVAPSPGLGPPSLLRLLGNLRTWEPARAWSLRGVGAQAGASCTPLSSCPPEVPLGPPGRPGCQKSTPGVPDLDPRGLALWGRGHIRWGELPETKEGPNDGWSCSVWKRLTGSSVGAEWEGAAWAMNTMCCRRRVSWDPDARATEA